MIRRERQASLEYVYEDTVWNSETMEFEQVPRDRPVCRIRDGKGNWVGNVMDVDEGDAAVESQRISPVCFGESSGKIWWMYEDEVYSTKEDLEPDEVQALILERTSKKKLKIARAKTVAAMAGGLDPKGRRQAIPREVKVAVWQRDNGRCTQCGRQEELEFDHIIPLARGGSNTERNLQLLCASCNREKGASL